VTIKIEYTEGMTMFDGEHYESKYITFHRPSEHFISAKQFELELQVHHVHILDASKRLAVVVMFVLSMNDNLLLEELEFDDLPTRAGDSKVLSAPFNLEHGMPMNPDYFVYDGSLTQPPCTEGVKFVVMNERPTLSAKQAKDFPFAANFRPPQMLNNRTIAFLSPAELYSYKTEYSRASSCQVRVVALVSCALLTLGLGHS